MILGIIAILIIIAFLIHIVLVIKSEWGWISFGECLLLIIMLALIYFLGLIGISSVYFATGKEIEEKISGKQEILSIKDKSTINGSWSLVGGSIEGTDYYYFWINTDKGNYRERVRTNNSYVIEEDIEKPYYETFTPICKHIDGYKTECMYKESRYVFHIPKGSIKYEYNLE